MIPDVNLSSSDAHVLTALFDPEAAPTSNLKIDPSLPAYPSISSASLPSLQRAELEAIRPLNVANPTHANLTAAVTALTSIIAKEPTYASAYANRAQARRLALGDTLFSADTVEEASLVFEDLDACIAYATPRSPASPLSPQQAKMLAAAHTHRGYLLMKASTVAAEKIALAVGPKEVRGRNSDELEEMASRDFFLGGRFGDRTAKDMSVRTNPYAKMCGAIVKEAMRKEIEEFKATY